MKNLSLVSLSLLMAVQVYSQAPMSQIEIFKGLQKAPTYSSSTDIKSRTLNVNKNLRLLKVEDIINSAPNNMPYQHDFLIRKALQQGKIGGGDIGGGNLIKGKPIEGYAIDISKMPEMTTALELVKQISSSRFPGEGLKEEVEHIVKNKVWYLIPLKLPSLSNSTVNTPFASEQGALQDFDEVWIENDSFIKMATEERVRLLIHEIFMGLKIFARESFFTQCKISESLPPEDCMELTRFTSRRTLALTPLDYADVRKAVKVTLENKEILTSMARAKLFSNEYLSNLKKLSKEIFDHGRFDTYYKFISTSTMSLKSFNDRDIAFAIIDKNATGLPKYCDHRVVEDLGNHRLKVQAQAIASYGLDTKKSGVISLRIRVQDIKGRVLLQNMYTPISENGTELNLAGVNSNKEKHDLTLSCGIEGCGYTASFLTKIREIKNSSIQAGLMSVGLTGSTINGIVFFTWNTRNLKENSFNDARDVYSCLDNYEYNCSGPECLRYLTK
jgi:hypothetical protein